LNEKPLSELAKEWIAFWMEENPGWSMRVWTPDQIGQLPLPLDLPDDLRDQVAKYMILFRHGGCVVDLFYESYGPLEPTVQNYSSFVYLSQLDTHALSLAGAFRKHSLFVEAEIAIRNKQYDFFRWSLRDRLRRHHCLVLSLR